MFKIDSDIVYLTRGDSAVMSVTLTDDSGAAYTMQDGDTLTLTVRETPSADADIVIQVVSATTDITISPEDTEDAEVGQYSADVQLTTSDGHIYTVWPPFDTGKLKSEKNWKNWWITPEVTR